MTCLDNDDVIKINKVRFDNKNGLITRATWKQVSPIEFWILVDRVPLKFKLQVFYGREDTVRCAGYPGQSENVKCRSNPIDIVAQK